MSDTTRCGTITGNHFDLTHGRSDLLTPAFSHRGPSDDQQFETMDAGHLLYLLLNSDNPNMLFRAPVSDPKVRRLCHMVDLVLMSKCRTSWT